MNFQFTAALVGRNLAHKRSWHINAHERSKTSKT